MIGLTIVQIILVLISIGFLFSGLWKFVKRERSQTFFKASYTALIWGGIIFLIIFPDFPQEFSRRFGLGESLNVLIFFGFVMVFMAIFRLLGSIERLEQSISELAREQALEKLRKIKEKKKRG